MLVSETLDPQEKPKVGTCPAQCPSAPRTGEWSASYVLPCRQPSIYLGHPTICRQHMYLYDTVIEFARDGVFEQLTKECHFFVCTSVHDSRFVGDDNVMRRRHPDFVNISFSIIFHTRISTVEMMLCGGPCTYVLFIVPLACYDRNFHPFVGIFYSEMPARSTLRDFAAVGC